MNQPSLEDLATKHIFIQVWLYNIGWVPAGVISFNDAHGFTGFSYFENYMKKDYPPLNPATLNYRDGNIRHFLVDPRQNADFLDRTFSELLPASQDFGHQSLINRFPQYQTMNHVQRLYFLGNRVVGGLCSYRKIIKDEVSITSTDWLEEVRKDSVAFHTHEIARLHQTGDAFLAMTSYGGMRPKAMYTDQDGRHWIAKFNLPTDPYDMAIAEHVAMNMARDSGMKVPDTQVIQLSSGENVFLTERFDRIGKNRRHSLSLYALSPGLDTGYKNPKKIASTLATLVRRFSDFKDADTANIVLKLLVDIGFNNTDNHLRNTRMILNDQNLWELSPVFDVVFNPRSQPHIYNPSGLVLDETHLSNPKLIESLANQTGADPEMIDRQCKKVNEVAQNWESYCDLAGMTSDDKLKIQSAINLGHNRAEMSYKIDRERKQKLHDTLKNIQNSPPPRPKF